MPFEIRRLNPADWPCVSEILEEAIKSNKATFRTCAPPYESWNKSHYRFGRLVACESNKAIGWAALSYMNVGCSSEGLGEVSVYIAEKNQRRGLGALLLEALKSEAEKNGLWTLQSVIMSDNEPSILLHEKCGFRIVGSCEKISRDKFGDWRHVVIMEYRSPLSEYN